MSCNDDERVQEALHNRFFRLNEVSILINECLDLDTVLQEILSSA